MIFQKLVWAGLAVAVVVGSVETGVQRLQAAPLILAAEVYEGQKAEAPSPVDTLTAPAQAAAVAHEHEHDHDHEHGGPAEWEPANGAERIGWTWVANVLHAFSMALLVFAVMGVWVYKRGAKLASLPLACLVAAAGGISFNLWPSLGLHAEVPGMEAAPLHARQLWWLLSMGSAALACAVLGFGHGAWRWIAAAALLALPFVVGAPELEGDALAGYSPEAHAALEQLAKQFILATNWVAASFWVTMGLASGLAFQRWVRPSLLEVLKVAGVSDASAVNAVR